MAFFDSVDGDSLSPEAVLNNLPLVATCLKRQPALRLVRLPNGVYINPALVIAVTEAPGEVNVLTRGGAGWTLSAADSPALQAEVVRLLVDA